MNTAALAAETASSLWPAPDTMVLRARPLRAGTDPDSLPCFGDATWHLQAAHPDVHAVAATLCWDRFPEPLILAFKAFALAALDHPYPVDPTVARGGDRPAVTTIGLWVRNLRFFARWLDDHDLTRLCDVTSADLDAYHRHVSALACSADRQRELLMAVRILSSYQVNLPAAARLVHDSWDDTGSSRLARPRWNSINKTPRIAEATMESLLAWSLTMIENIGGDILAAHSDYQHLDAGTHPSQAALAHLGPADRVRAFVAQARRDHTVLPGHPSAGTPAINWFHLARLLGLYPSALARAELRCVVTESGLDVGADSFIGSISARIAGRPWRDRPISVADTADHAAPAVGGLLCGHLLPVGDAARRSVESAPRLRRPGRAHRGAARLRPPGQGPRPLSRREGKAIGAAAMGGRDPGPPRHRRLGTRRRWRAAVPRQPDPPWEPPHRWPAGPCVSSCQCRYRGLHRLGEPQLPGARRRCRHSARPDRPHSRLPGSAAPWPTSSSAAPAASLRPHCNTGTSIPK